MDNCRHWWLIEEVKSGPEAHGQCRRCGAERMFRVEIGPIATRLWNTQQKRAEAAAARERA